MKKRFFIMLLLITIFGLAIFAVTSTDVYYNNSISYAEKTLCVYANQYNEETYSFDTTGAKKLSDNLGGARVTFLDNEAMVVGDSEIESVDINESHANREEVISAFKNGAGYSVRSSSTLGESLIYYCRRLDNNQGYIRIAIPTSSQLSIFIDSLPTIIIYLLLDVFICSLFSLIFVEKTLDPVKKIAIDGALGKETSTKYEELKPISDIINRRNDEIKDKIEKIKESKALREIVLNNMEHGMIILSKDYEVILINNKIRELFNIIEDDEIVTKLEEEFSIKESLEKDNNLLLYKKVDQNYYAIRVNADGDAIIVLITDVTEIKRIEKSKNDFIGNVTHEMNTPLTSIKGFAELIKNGELSDEKAKHAGDIILKQSNRLVTLVKNIINYSSFESDDLPSYQVNVTNIVKSISQSVEEMANQKNIIISLDLDENLMIDSREERVTEVVTNLISNAIKYNKDNGHIKILLKNDGNKKYLSVEDDGIGIGIEDQEKVFDRFYTVNKSHNENFSGFGLGLAIVKKICNMSKWQLKLESELNKGSKFTIMF